MRFPNIQDVIESGLNEDDREPDGLLHCSKHIWWPLRFTQLEMEGHTMQPPELLDRVTMMTGTMWHTQVEDWLKRDKSRWWELVASEVDLTAYLPNGWTGTADWVFYDKEADHCILGDLKTIKPEGIQYLSGMKEDHLAQLSCYYSGLTKAGYSMAPEMFVFYLPKNKVWTHKVTPQQLHSAPIANIESIMTGIKDKVDDYLAGSRNLYPMPAPTYKWSYNKRMNVFDIKEHPDWREAYTCPFDESLCPRTPVRKIGHWTIDKKYVSRIESKRNQGLGAMPPEAEFRKRK